MRIYFRPLKEKITGKMRAACVRWHASCCENWLAATMNSVSDSCYWELDSWRDFQARLIIKQTFRPQTTINSLLDNIDFNHVSCWIVICILFVCCFKCHFNHNIDVIYFYFDFMGINTSNKMGSHKKYIFRFFSFPYLDRNICMWLYIVNNCAWWLDSNFRTTGT